MTCVQLGKKAHRVTNKSELARITRPLFDRDLSKIDYSVSGLPVTGRALRQVGAGMDLHRIETYIDPDLPHQGETDSCGSPPGTVRVIFNASNVMPFNTEAQALVIHEAVHASLRRKGLATGGPIEEAAAYLAQALFFELRGESILEAWEDDNQWLFNQRHIDDPIQASPKARIYAAAERVIDRHSLDSRCVALKASHIEDLLKAIAKAPGYREPAKPPAPKRSRPATLRERLRQRREQRRARWGR